MIDLSRFFSVKEAKAKLSELITKAQDDPVIITKNSKPFVVVMSIPNYNRILRELELCAERSSSEE